MQAIRSILVVVDPSQNEDLALKRAKLIASVTQSHLHILICDKKTDHSALLCDLTEELNNEGFSVTSQQAWNESLHQTIVTVQQSEGCGLVVKQHSHDSLLKKAILTPDDWKVLRYCPAPVLLVKTDTSWTDGVILAAVDVGNSDAEHRTLHSTIVSHGYEIATLAQSALHVVSAHPSPMLSAADPTFQLTETIQARYRANCAEFQKQYDVTDDRLHIVEGPADVLIPQTAKRLNASVVVVGTVARTGLSGVLIGNTAEVILDTLETDILVLKPDDIIEHLEQLVAQR
ncbi:universal stress protein [Ectopseudomonas mendocina]|uniref:Universal stress protein n=1 Tax=Ectopseudomonas mendocina TaxID=300 RepID=A0ABZ2RLQ6_ECTME